MRLVDTNFTFNTLKWKEEDIALKVINSINTNDSNASLNLIVITLNWGSEKERWSSNLCSLLLLYFHIWDRISSEEKEGLWEKEFNHFLLFHISSLSSVYLLTFTSSLLLFLMLNWSDLSSHSSMLWGSALITPQGSSAKRKVIFISVIGLRV